MNSSDMLARVRTMLQEAGGNSGVYAFAVSGITTVPAPGAIYTNNTQAFTLLSVSVSGTAPTIAGTIFCKGTGSPTASGTLTPVYGAGDAPLAFSAYSQVSSGFWSDPEIYAALTDGQRELIHRALALYIAQTDLSTDVDLPPILQRLEKSGTITITSATGPLPSDFIHFLYGTLGTQWILRRKQNRQGFFAQNNTLLQAGTKEIYLSYIGNGTINFESSSTSGTATIWYISTPLAITPTQDPTVPDDQHNAVVQFAYQELLKKNEEDTRNSVNEFQQFQAMR